MVRLVVYLLGSLLAVVALAVLGVAALAGALDPATWHDRAREEALYSVASDLHARYGIKHAPLPLTLSNLPPGIAYTNLGNGEYQLCADFERDRPGGTGTWSHYRGRSCFQFSVYDRTWMDPKNRRWIFPTC